MRYTGSTVLDEVSYVHKATRRDVLACCQQMERRLSPRVSSVDIRALVAQEAHDDARLLSIVVEVEQRGGGGDRRHEWRAAARVEGVDPRVGVAREKGVNGIGL